jgi:hypothetical protein
MGGPSLILAGVIVGFLLFFKDESGRHWIMLLLGAALGAVVGGLIYVIISVILIGTMPTQQYTTSKHDLLPLTDKYYLGNGSVNGYIEWSYMEKAPQGNTITTAKADTILVNQDKGLKQPYVEQVTKRFTSSKVESLFPAEFLTGKATVIHVPENAIKYGYNLSVSD